jgi:hypothetical protein
VTDSNQFQTSHVDLEGAVGGVADDLAVVGHVVVGALRALDAGGQHARAVGSSWDGAKLAVGITD